MNENTWRFVKKRTAADGAVYVSTDRTRYRRTGGTELQAEAAFQRQIAALDYPVPHILEEGFSDDGHYYVVEESLGDQTLHDRALASLNGGRALADDVTDTAAQVAPGCCEPRPPTSSSPRPARCGSGWTRPGSPRTSSRRTPIWTPPGPGPHSIT